MYKTLSLLLIFFLGFHFSIFSQNIEKTRERIEKLASPEFYGRGYVKNGINISADYIKNEIEEIGLKYFGDSYFQPLNYDINTFPSSLDVKLDSRQLTPGIDYIIGPQTPTLKKKYELYIPDSLLLNNIEEFTRQVRSSDNSKKMLVIDYALLNDTEIKWFYIYVMMSNYFKFGGIAELIAEELMVSVRTDQQDFPVIKIKRESFPKDSKTININVKADLLKDFESNNIIGYIPGEKEEFIVFTAHYDHLGKMGKDIYIPGAQDNASGTAMLLDLAEYYMKNKPEYSIAFMFFTGEEVGLLGSSHYVRNPLFDLSKIKTVINLDMVGTGDSGIGIVNVKMEGYENIWETIQDINSENEYFDNIIARGESPNSDHHSFHAKGVAAIFIYTTGGQTYYHNMKDKPETLTFTGYEQLFGLLTKFVERYE